LGPTLRPRTDFASAKKITHSVAVVTRWVCPATPEYDWEILLSPLLKRIAFALSFLLLLPMIATVAAPPPGVHISTPNISPSSPGPNDQVTVTVTVTSGAGVQNVTIHYTTDNWKATNTTVVASYNSTSNQATAHIPPQYNGGHVEYYVEAFDTSGNQGTNNNGGNYYSYTVPAPSSSALTSMWIEIAIVLVVVGAAVSIGFYSLRQKSTPTRQ
jgi:hypothetical protein